MGFFFTQQEKNALYAENFADNIEREAGEESLQGYFQEQEHAGSQSMLWVDLMTYLPDDILVKVDRMSMACSLEVRVPLLDHKVVEFMARVPVHHKFTLRRSKYLLRRLAARYLPGEILQRPKQGFALPVGRWLQEDLRSWMEDLLLSSTSLERGYFNAAAIEQMIHNHLSGRRDYSQQLWALMVLELWFQKERSRGGAA